MITTSALAPERLLAPLASIVGQEHARLRDGTIVVAPGDVSQVAEVLRFAQANRLAVTPTGGGTKPDWGHSVAADIQLSMRRMAKVREHAWQDMTCTVEAGCAWAEMQRVLAGHGQMVALDPLWPERATVGGILATNDSGALRIRFGGLRDLVIGLTFVLADGTIAKSGGKVVKNVAGYDLHKLLTGSFGTLGVIAEVNFRLHPAERFGQTWSVTARGPQAADPISFAQPLSVLMDSQMTPSSVQLRASTKECALDIRVASLPECVGEYETRIRSIFDGYTVTASDDAAWDARQQIFDSNFEVVLKASVVAGEVCSVASELQKWAHGEGADIAMVCQANGLMTVGLHSHGDAAVRLVELLRGRLRNSGGSAIALRISDAIRDAVDVWGPHPDALALMREIKRRFDPGRILNPGRFVGNI
ncbi:MAG TPA: FAD-binding oxidoreductase [Candidatus Angelobacter sp.]|nr:FAD-binding oxidoreductase [Candidatus Angelobacter sp.]